MMNCSGIDASSGAGIDISCDGEAIAQVRPASQQPAGWIAPGWVDIQVNGFAGVDYNTPTTPHEEIARSIQVLYSAGVTRFYPTVITGAPNDMAGALRNLTRAKQSLP